MPSLKPLYNSQEKKPYAPMEVEGDGSWVLYSLFTDFGTNEVPTELDVSFGVCYCVSDSDHSVIYTLCNKAWTTLCNHWLKKKDANGKNVDDPEKAKLYNEVKELASKNFGRSIIYVNGHEGLETIVKHYNRKWVKLDGSLLTKDSSKVLQLLVGIDSGEIDEDLASEVTNGDIQPLLTYTDVPRAGLKGKPLPALVHPEVEGIMTKEDLSELDELGEPLAVTKLTLPVVRYGGGSRGKSPQEKFQENLKVILEFLKLKSYDELIEMSINHPLRVRTAFAILGSGYSLSPEEFELSKSSEVVYLVEQTEEETEE